jgi:type I restriction enzyme S subunit
MKLCGDWVNIYQDLKTHQMKRYDSYKHSGIDDIEEIPFHWEVRNLQALAKNEKYSFTGGPFGSDLKFDDYTVSGVRIIQLQNIGDGNFNDDYKIYTSNQKADSLFSCNIFPGEIIIAKMADPVARACIIPDTESRFLMASDGIRLLVDENVSNSQFATYSINSNYFRSQAIMNSSGSTRSRIGLNILKKLKFVLPPINEQIIITSFLDQKTAQIDKLIADKQKLIELLNEERTAMINQAVTKGLSPNVPMKDSGVEWIGKIPEHWEIKRLKYIGVAFGGLTYSPDDVVLENEGTLVLRSSNIQSGKLSLNDNVFVKSKISEKLTLRKGDILICSRNGSQHLIGKNICIENDMEGNTFGAFMMVFRSDNWKFLKQYFNSSIFTSQSGLFLTATINQLTSNTINNFWIALPQSIKEQELISEYVDDKKQEVQIIINKTNQEIELLKEYKTALISEVVTGKVDVRGEVIESRHAEFTSASA